ncbi:TonB-dependent siderophore receptor [Asaia prunellae]|uniref:TonB-dependent siderophore receptor n=1 Tax=Asaia prunellae TaxID=610245 RepID=UPI001FB0D1F6|nr:TonB-dependent receptor [Asaia prunellae]
MSYSTSFQPQTGLVSGDGGKTTHTPSPSLGKQLEGGVKYQIPGTPILLSAAGFHLMQTNVIVTAGNMPWGTQSGLVHSDGFEVEGHVNSWHNLQIDAAVGTQDVHDDSTGHPLVQSNKGSATFFAMYTLPHGSLAGVGLGAGVRYVMSGYGGQGAARTTIVQGMSIPGGSVTVPGYTLFDGSLRYDLGKSSPGLRGWVLQASVRNIFDRKFISSCFSFGSPSGWCWYGERRNAQGSIGFSW